MKKFKIYLDTTIFNFAFADDAPVVGINMLMGYGPIDIYSPLEVVKNV